MRREFGFSHWLLIIACLLALLYWWLSRASEPTIARQASDPVDVRERPPPPPSRPPITEHPSFILAGEYLAPQSDATRDEEILGTLLSDYARALGENPVGENEEVVAALQGKNAKGLRFFPDRHPALSPEGKLLDRWGTPWFFHALSGHQMELLSAGPDREFGSSDDRRCLLGR